jgi:hemerythrin-like metal-binding protein
MKMADFYSWDPSRLSVKVTAMDDEHKVLISKMNALHAAHTQGKDKAAIQVILNDFVQYTLKHFADEEAYMAKIQFAGTDTHKLIHKQLLGKVKEHIAAFEASGKLTNDFFTFLSVWLTAHIRGVDAKYGE